MQQAECGTQTVYYTDGKREFFVHDGISLGISWGTFWRKPDGSLRQVKSPWLPTRCNRSLAQADLEDWAEARGLRRVDPQRRLDWAVRRLG